MDGHAFKGLGEAFGSLIQFVAFASVVLVILGVSLLVGLPAAWYFGSTAGDSIPDCPCECPSEVIAPDDLKE